MEKTLEQNGPYSTLVKLLGTLTFPNIIRGSSHHLAKMDDAEIKMIFAMRKRGASIGIIASAFKLSKSTVHDYLTGKVRTQGWPETKR